MNNLIIGISEMAVSNRSRRHADHLLAGLVPRRDILRSRLKNRRNDSLHVAPLQHRCGKGPSIALYVRRYGSAQIAGGDVCLGLSKTQYLITRLAGAANVLDSKHLFRIGETKLRGLPQDSLEEQLLISAEDVGGQISRTIRLKIATGDNDHQKQRSGIFAMNHENGHSKDSLRAQIEARLNAFPAMPAFVAQIATLARSPDTDIRQIADRVRLDPGVTANILKLANSAEFGAARSIHSLQEAIVRLGLKQLFQMIVAYGIAPRLAKAMPGYELRPEELLAHSLWTALASEEFCRVLRVPTPDMIFTAGLLHDLGKLALDEFVATLKNELKQEARDRSIAFDEAERNCLGLSHAEAGAAILDRWNFPAPLVAAARWHHQPDQAGSLSPLVSIVHIAEFLAYEAGVGAGVDGFTYRLSDAAVTRLGLKTKIIEYVASQTLDKMNNLEQLLLKP